MQTPVSYTHLDVYKRQDKDHLGALQGICDLVLAFLGSTLADLGISARAAALGELGAQLHLGEMCIRDSYTLF